MGNSDRNATSDIAVKAPAIKDVRTYNFFQLIETIQRVAGIDAESEDWEKFCRIVFSANPSLGFAPCDVTEVTETEDERFVVQTNFFGLAGANSPLPGFIVEQLLGEESRDIKRPFLDFFNNRLITLVYRAWRKYRYYIRFQGGASDEFSQQLFSLVGLGDPHLRADTDIHWGKMLAYAGMLAGRGRSPQVVAGIIAHCFDLDDVSIRQWERRKIAIDSSQQCSLGSMNSELGVNALVGSSAFDCSGKFVICIGNLTLQQFTEFLPTGKNYTTLYKLVEFILREQLAYDLELTLDEKEVPPLKLNSNGGVALGWYSFLGDNDKDKSVLIQVRR